MLVIELSESIIKSRVCPLLKLSVIHIWIHRNRSWEKYVILFYITYEVSIEFLHKN